MAYTYDTETTAGSWFGVTADNLETADRGDTTLKLSTILSGTGGTSSLWVEASNPSFPQEFTLDLGSARLITKVRSRSAYFVNINSFDVYVSETNGNWGTAVVTSINPASYGTSYGENATTPKIGRYVRVVINNSTFPPLLAWGFTTGFGNCFDVFVGYDYDSEPSGTVTYNQTDRTYNNSGMSYNEVDTYVNDIEP